MKNKYKAGLAAVLLIALVCIMPGYGRFADVAEVMKGQGGALGQDPYEKTQGVEEEGQFTIVIDPGHGGMDGGAETSDGIKEKDLNLEIALRLRDVAKRYCTIDEKSQDAEPKTGRRINVIMTRDSDVCLGAEETDGSIRSMKIKDIHERKRIIDQAKPDITVSIHLNNFKQDSGVRGAQTFYPGESGVASDFAAHKTGESDNMMGAASPSEESLEVAKKIQEAIEKNIDYGKQRVAMEKNNIYIFQNIYTPIVLIECGFLSNSGDLTIAQNPIFQQKIAESIMLALSEYYTLKPAKKFTVVDSRT